MERTPNRRIYRDCLNTGAGKTPEDLLAARVTCERDERARGIRLQFDPVGQTAAAKPRGTGLNVTTQFSKVASGNHLFQRGERLDNLPSAVQGRSVSFERTLRAIVFL